jgi:sulfopyruvate decarboxylase TPP-binding subunit
MRLVPVCREGEAWAIAAGLLLGSARPLVMIQCTGLFESGDALRNALFDYKLPLFAVIGYRSYLNQTTLPGDTARSYTEPILKGGGIVDRLFDEPAKRNQIRDLYLKCQRSRQPGVALIAEGKV